MCRSNSLTLGHVVNVLLLMLLMSTQLTPVLGVTIAKAFDAEAPATTSDTSPLPYAGSYGGGINAIQIVGDIAYIGEGAAITVIDVSEPSSPIPVAHIPFSHEVGSLAVEGPVMMVGFGQAVQLLDIVNPTKPQLRGVYKIPDGGYVADVAVEGTRAYFAAGEHGLP